VLNILIPLAGKDPYFSEESSRYPRMLIEIDGVTIIERVIRNYDTVQGAKRFIFVVDGKDCRRYHLDNILKLLTDESSAVIQVHGDTSGAACSALLAIEAIYSKDSLVIANSDQVFDDDVNGFIEAFSKADAGVVTFESIHPRWSYVGTDASGAVVEAAEKAPISKNAIAGFYFFSRGEDFVTGAMSMIRKDASVNGQFYVAPVLNELILRGKRVAHLAVQKDRYHTFYTPAKIHDFERITAPQHDR
jgi:NDP-sugar pyrophosphorylase family protein